jgi:hypothetical protein
VLAAAAFIRRTSNFHRIVMPEKSCVNRNPSGEADFFKELWKNADLFAVVAA